MEHHHRAGNLKQSNKGFKSKHASNRSIKKKAGGKVESPIKSTAVKQLVKDKKESRKNKAKQLTKNRREQILAKNRKFAESLPRLVTLIDLGDGGIETAKKIHEKLYLESKNKNNFEEPKKRGKEEMEEDAETKENIGEIPSTFFVPQWKQRVTVSACRRNLDEILIKTQTSDILIFLIPSTGVSNEALDVIKIISAHGFPSMFSVVDFHENKLSKKDFESFFSLEFGEKQFKVLDLQKTSEILRFICQIGLKDASISRNIPRPYLYSDLKPNLIDFTSPSGQEMKLVEISGFIRGGSLSPNQLLHFYEFGDFQIHSISPKPDPFLVKHSSSAASSAASSQVDISEFYTPAFSEEGKMESLVAANEVDRMEGEQTLFSDEEDDKREKKEENIESKKKKPAGMSEYQASWIEDELIEEDDEEEARMREIRKRNISLEESISRMKLIESDGEEDEELDFLDTQSNFSRATTARSELEEKKMLEKEDIDFPDEVDTPKEISARIQFAKYRGLKSFRTSPWDPKENLPRNYSRIFQFRAFKQLQNRIINNHDGIPEGTFVSIKIYDGSEKMIEFFEKNGFNLVIGLFKHERKVSVLNFTIKRFAAFEDPVESKDNLIFYCGFRKLNCQPIFTENSQNSDKFKFEKFLIPNSTSVASIYGPAMFLPCPLLVFKKAGIDDEVQSGSRIDNFHLVATGSLISVNPDRLNIKKITLTGEPFRILKRKAVIRRMFWNPEDIRWFKPVELRTKLGRTGVILESVGTHGYMRCLFDARLQQNDVVLMNLYKRAYPKWGTAYDLSYDNPAHNL